MFQAISVRSFVVSFIIVYSFSLLTAKCSVVISVIDGLVVLCAVCMYLEGNAWTQYDQKEDILTTYL